MTPGPERRGNTAEDMLYVAPGNPGLTGASFGNSHLNLTQVRTIVTTQMPLTAPGSLKPGDYASILAYLLSYGCVRNAGGGAQQFPTIADQKFSAVILGGRSCPAKAPGHE